MNEKEFNVLDILHVLWLHKILIIILSVFAAVLVFVKLSYFTKPEYVADGMLYVSNKLSTDSTGKISQSDILSSRELSATYVEVLKTRSFLSTVSDITNNELTWQQIQGMTTITSVNDTELLSVSVSADTPEQAYLLAKTILEQAPDKLFNVAGSGEVEIVNEAVFPSAPVNQSVPLKTAIGFLIGAILGAVIALMMGFFDTKIHKSEDLTKRYGCSVLGELS